MNDYDSGPYYYVQLVGESESQTSDVEGKVTWHGEVCSGDAPPSLIGVGADLLLRDCTHSAAITHLDAR